MATIRKSHIVKKRNVLNEMLATDMSLQELRFFSIYLSKINPSDLQTRVMRFPLTDFQNIMELGRINIDYMKQVTNKLLRKIVNVPTERGGYMGFQLFKKCIVDIDESGEWYIQIDAHDDALPLLFEYKEKYFSYQLWNVLRLKSPNQLRMYEFLKQYENIGERVVSVDRLKEYIGIEKDEYHNRFDNFRKWVLDACQRILKENTDIKFTYEPWGKRGKGGKIQFLKFMIQKNDNNVAKLTLDEFIEKRETSIPDKLKVEKLKSEPAIKLDLVTAELGFITEKLTDKELLSIWNAANGDAKLIHKRYDAVKRKKDVNNLVGFLLWSIQHPDENFDTIKSTGKNKFINYESRSVDFSEIERLEREKLMKEYEQSLEA